MSDLSNLLTVDEVAAMLRMSPAWVRQHANGARAPHIPCVKFGKALRFRAEDIAAVIEQQRRGAAA